MGTTAMVSIRSAKVTGAIMLESLSTAISSTILAGTSKVEIVVAPATEQKPHLRHLV
jgi:hypothetical protein